ncbi:MAG: UbiA family prenyltransferase [Candidatus Aenigmarchaeota archaeon]|nr:UbiA family prenyltransferase [Candidatus Aenigmarchaeota archaeon]
MSDNKPNGILFAIKEVRAFVRAETGLFVSGIALSGYLLFNNISLAAFFVMAAAFFSSCAIYSYNHLKDKKEYLVNNERINHFAAGRSGHYITAACICLSFMFSLFLSLFSFLAYFVSLACGMLYSAFRMKTFYFFKNIYTGLVFSIVFLMGEVTAGIFTYEMVEYLAVPFLAGIILNLLGDIRGHKGDRSAGLKTLPVTIGVERAKLILHVVVWSLVLLISVRYTTLFSMVPFLVMLSVFLINNNMKVTRACILLSFVTVPVFLMVIKWI